jgi:uncharacterized protein (DUF2267 family)
VSRPTRPVHRDDRAQGRALRAGGGRARHLTEQLPPEPAAWLATDGPAELFDVDEFVRRVAEREGVDPGTAERHAHAVFEALGRVVSEDEIDDMAAELPSDFEPLVAQARHRFVHMMSPDEFRRRVAERAGLDADGARRATDAVLITLAERISGREGLPRPSWDELDDGRRPAYLAPRARTKEDRHDRAGRAHHAVAT